MNDPAELVCKMIVIGGEERYVVGYDPVGNGGDLPDSTLYGPHIITDKGRILVSDLPDNLTVKERG